MRKRKTERGSGRSSGYFPKLKKKPEKGARKLKQKNNNQKKKNLQKQNKTRKHRKCRVFSSDIGLCLLKQLPGCSRGWGSQEEPSYFNSL